MLRLRKKGKTDKKVSKRFIWPLIKSFRRSLFFLFQLRNCCCERKRTTTWFAQNKYLLLFLKLLILRLVSGKTKTWQNNVFFYHSHQCLVCSFKTRLCLKTLQTTFTRYFFSPTSNLTVDTSVKKNNISHLTFQQQTIFDKQYFQQNDISYL